MGVSTSVFGYWLVIAEYRELGIQIPRISGHRCRTRHCVHRLLLCFNMFHGRCIVVICIIDIVDCIWNTRVRKHNLRGSENKMNMIVRELMGISVTPQTRGIR